MTHEPRFDFGANGDIHHLATGNYIGCIDSDGDIRVDTDVIEAQVLADLRAQFATRAGGNWPERPEWPIALLRAIGEERGAS